MVRVPVAEVERFTSSVLRELGTPADVAEMVAESLVEADLSGHHSHGVRMVGVYAHRVDDGRIDPRARPSMVRETATTAIVDGNTAFGQVVGREAIGTVVSKAHSEAVATVGIRNASHLGRIGEWAELAAEEELAFVGFTCNPGSRYVAVPGSSQALLSTNPVTIGLPSFGALEHPVVLDMATSQVAFGKVRERLTADEPVPGPWLASREPDDGPDSATEHTPGALLPLGGQISGYKGFGLAAMSELLAATVSDGWVSGQSGAFDGNQAAFVLLDPLQFTRREAITERIREFREYVRSPDRDPDLNIGAGAYGTELLLPGEPEFLCRRDQRDKGLLIADDDAEELYALAADIGLEAAAPFDPETFE